MKKHYLLYFITVLTMAIPTMAEERNEISELKKQITQLQARLEKIESEQKLAASETKEEAKVPDSLKWAENIDISGDFRYRYEQINAEGKEDRGRNRIRARLNIKGEISEELDFNLRLATGSDDPVSTNQTLDGSFSSKSFWLDRAYLTWRATENLTVLAGKTPNPFYSPAKTQLIWDGDLNPEGASVKYQTEMGDAVFFVNSGMMWVEENSSDVDQGLFGVQAGIETMLGESKLKFGASYFDYGNMEGTKTFYNNNDGVGNTTVDAVDGNGNDIERYVYDYNLFEGFAEVSFDAGLPVSLYGDYVVNTASNVDQDTGWLVGCTLGKAKTPGSWELSYNYRDLEADAVVGAFSDSDFIGGGTDGKGHKVGIKYAINKNLSLGTTFLTNKAGNNEKDYDRLQVDLSLKF